MKVVNAFKAAQQPTAVIFANGRGEALPSLSAKPSRIKSALIYTTFTSVGLGFGIVSGFTTGFLAADEKLKKDMESRRRIMTAYKRYRAGLLKIRVETWRRTYVNRKAGSLHGKHKYGSLYALQTPSG
ncbi:MAG: hypothetical protein Q9213_007983 [Squamulea squamosa]